MTGPSLGPQPSDPAASSTPPPGGPAGTVFITPGFIAPGLNTPSSPGAEPADAGHHGPGSSPLPSVTSHSIALVAAGGAIGSLLRWTTSELLAGISGGFPWATYLVNVLGSFLLGILYGILRRKADEPLRLFAGVGLLGGFTTFSTYTVDAVRHALAGQVTVTVGYALSSVVACTIAAALGLLATRGSAPRAPADE